MRYRVMLTALDDQVITKRTGRIEVIATCNRLPNEGDYIMFLYEDRKIESPGVAIATDNVVENNNRYFFNDNQKRQFMVRILEVINED